MWLDDAGAVVVLEAVGVDVGVAVDVTPVDGAAEEYRVIVDEPDVTVTAVEATTPLRCHVNLSTAAGLGHSTYAREQMDDAPE